MSGVSAPVPDRYGNLHRMLLSVETGRRKAGRRILLPAKGAENRKSCTFPYNFFKNNFLFLLLCGFVLCIPVILHDILHLLE
jgi:hypothetical protein